MAPFHAREHAGGAQSPRKEGARLAQRQRARRGGRLAQDFGPDALGIPHQVDFTWDHPTGQLQSITSPTGTIDVGYTQGKMTSLVSPSLAGPITTNIAYDGPLPTALGWSGPVAGQVSWTYNDRFLIETETIGALPATTVAYQYDNDGLVPRQQIFDPGDRHSDRVVIYPSA